MTYHERLYRQFKNDMSSYQNPLTGPDDGLPRMSTRDYFAIHFAVALVQINRKDQVICNMGAAADMADALIRILETPPKPTVHEPGSQS